MTSTTSPIFRPVEITKPNQPPTFTVTEPDQTAQEDSGENIILDWATEIYDGDNDTQALEFWVIGNTDPYLFSRRTFGFLGRYPELHASR